MKARVALMRGVVGTVMPVVEWVVVGYFGAAILGMEDVGTGDVCVCVCWQATRVGLTVD